MKLTLIRHGLTEGNIRRLYYGAMDLPLLPDGIEALHALRDGGGYPEAEQYFTSGMTRTEQTFAALYGDRPHGTLPGMQEMRFGEFEGRTTRPSARGAAAIMKTTSAPAARAGTA